jgi:hypothetical protein
MLTLFLEFCVRLKVSYFSPICTNLLIHCVSSLFILSLSLHSLEYYSYTVSTVSSDDIYLETSVHCKFHFRLIFTYILVYLNLLA